MQKIRIPMKSVHEAAELSGLARDAGWEIHSISEETETKPYQIIWVTGDGKSIVRFINDFMIEVPYAYIESEDAALIVRNINQFVDVYSNDDIRRMADSATTAEEHHLAVRLMALIAPPAFDQAFFDFFRKSLTFPEPSVRHKAILAIGYVGWKELFPVLEQLAKEDKDAEVRERARVALEGFAKFGPGGA